MSQLRPSVRAMLAAAVAETPPPVGLSVPELRAFCEDGVVTRAQQYVRAVAPLHDVRDVVSPGGVPVRLYLPTDAEDLPLHVHLHGGGWWMGSIETVDPMCRELAAAGMKVASVDYRLAPEHPWPAALNDVYDVVCWLSATHRSMSVGGESAGANLAAAVSLLARDRSGPALAAQWLDVPAVDLTLPLADSMREFGAGFGLEAEQLPTIVSWYADDLEHPYVSPARADLTGLPPTILTTAEFDPLRDQGEAFARQLAAAAVPVDLRRAAGHIHASSWFTALDGETAAWHDAVVSALLRHHQALACAS